MNITMLKKIVKNPLKIFSAISSSPIFYLMSDEMFLKLKFKGVLGYPLNLDSPKMFNEKLQWLKIHDHNPLYTTLVDKYKVKKYVESRIGSEYIIPTLGVWERFDDINFSKLPNQFVLKCTHDSGGLVICRDKHKLDIKAARKKINKSLRNNYFYNGREWPYKNVRPRIIAEQYMEDAESRDLKDYKFYCFNGEPVYCQVISNRSTHETIDFFDMKWIHQDFTGLLLPSKPFSTTSIQKPIKFDEMSKIARVLSKESRFLRVDFYEVKGNLYFGELTFYPASGFGEFTPKKYNMVIGEMLKLHEEPKKKFVYNEQTGG